MPSTSCSSAAYSVPVGATGRHGPHISRPQQMLLPGGMQHKGRMHPSVAAAAAGGPCLAARARGAISRRPAVAVYAGRVSSSHVSSSQDQQHRTLAPPDTGHQRAAWSMYGNVIVHGITSVLAPLCMQPPTAAAGGNGPSPPTPQVELPVKCAIALGLQLHSMAMHIHE
jgi:hypothetical protein